MAEHTPGPLSIEKIQDTLGSWYIRDARGSAIGAAYAGFVSVDGSSSTFPAEANARLWAASPCLLEALLQARQALALAVSCWICGDRMNDDDRQHIDKVQGVIRDALALVQKTEVPS